MGLRKIEAGLALILAALAAPCGAAERPMVVVEAMKLESNRKVYDVAVFRPNDEGKHPAIVYLHGGGFSFEDPVMVRFNTELAKRGLVVVAPHWLISGTGAKDWEVTSKKLVTFAASLPNADPDHLGISGISLGGQVGLSAAARDPRVKAVAEFFTAWPGSMPDEPIDKLPPVLLLNGTEDPIIPLDWAFMLDGILKERHMPYERKLYEGVGHGFGNGPAFDDAVVRTAVFFGGTAEATGSSPKPASPALPMESRLGSPYANDGLQDDDEFIAMVDLYSWSRRARSAAVISKKKKRRPLVASPSTVARP